MCYFSTFFLISYNKLEVLGMSLCDLSLNKSAIILKIDQPDDIKRRLYDMGFTEGTEVMLLLISPSKHIKGYLVRESLIALRDKDAKNILVSDVNEE